MLLEIPYEYSLPILTSIIVSCSAVLLYKIKNNK